MARKPPVSKLPKPKAPAHSDVQSWHNGGDIEIALYARSLHRAAKTLIAALDLKPNVRTAWDASPVILLYRQAVELHLKALVDTGNNFLPSPTDSITLYKTHSLRWLAQIVCQIIRKVRWEDEFKCEGITSLADFSAVVNELEELDPVSYAVHSASRDRGGSAPPQLLPPNIVRFAARLDAFLDLLAATADGLAATWDLQQDGISEEDFGDGQSFKSTIH